MNLERGNKILLSVIIPVYNGQKYIFRAVKSVLGAIKGFEHEVEIIVVDDGSTDNTAHMLREFTILDNFLLITQENRGVTMARWHGLELAHGRWVTFLDGDDMLSPRFYEIVKPLLQPADAPNPSHLILFDLIRFIDDTKDVFPNASISGVVERVEAPPEGLCAAVLGGRLMPGVCGSIFRRKDLMECREEFCNGLKVAEDTMFCCRFLLKRPRRIYRLREKLYGYRENPESVTGSFAPRRYQAVNEAIDYIDGWLRGDTTASHSKSIARGAAFRQLLLWSGYMFNPDDVYYPDKALRQRMRHCYRKAFRYLYPYLRVYLLIDLFISPSLAQFLISKRK